VVAASAVPVPVWTADTVREVRPESAGGTVVVDVQVDVVVRVVRAELETVFGVVRANNVFSELVLVLEEVTAALSRLVAALSVTLPVMVVVMTVVLPSIVVGTTAVKTVYGTYSTCPLSASKAIFSEFAISSLATSAGTPIA